VIAQLLTATFSPPLNASDPSAEEKNIHALQQTMLRENLIDHLVASLDHVDIAFWHQPFAIVARLVMSSQHFARSFLDAGGLQPDRMKAILDPRRSTNALIGDGLNVLSQLARLSKEYYPPIHEASLYDCLIALLRHSDAGVRSKTCNFIGNLCKHSSFFYEPLLQHHVVKEVVARCNDDDAVTQKFAAFAAGNAAFHSDLLYSVLRPSIPSIVRLLQSPDEKSRQNAAGAISNFVRNGSSLCRALLSDGALEGVVRVLSSDTPALRKIALITVGSLCAYDECRARLLALGLTEVLGRVEQELKGNPDASVAKYIARIRQRIA
jgi:fused-like protein